MKSSLAAGCLPDEKVAAFIEGKLDSLARADVEEHLETCDACQRLIGAVARGARADGDAREERAPPADRPMRIDEFELVRRLGRGGMGDVWLARDTLLERDVAIKLVRGAMTDEARRRFVIESRAVARLRHPNILAVHHAGELDGQPFLVTELLRGDSLDALGKVPAAQVATLGVDLSRALAAAHAAGVLHRDIKPANAFRCDDGSAKLLDFGLAQLARDPASSFASDTPAAEAIGALDTTQPEVSSSGRVVGTPHFMAPETWRGEPATPATDVYSFGALLFALLAGAPPHARADTLRALRDDVLRGPIPDVAQAAPDAPRALVGLLARCLSREPEARPSIDEVCIELQASIPTAAPLTASDPDDDPGGNPYRGLLAFEADHRRLFFGREAETAAVLAELVGAPFVLVVGASGAGKSSLVRAGVVPRLLAGALGREAWSVATMVPGDRPVARLAQALAPILAEDEEPTLRELRSSPSWGAAQIEARDIRLLLVVDQLEEAWTLSRREERLAFFDALAAFAAVGPRVRLVATLRVDFLGRIGDLGDLGALALRAPVVLGPMSTDGLRRAITLPARLCGVDADPALVDALVEKHAGGTLPLLEFTLGLIWERREGGAARMSLEDLDALGGLEGALASHADGVLNRLSPARRAEARRILTSLVTADRTRARREEAALVGGGDEARAALDALVEGRLAVATAGDETTAYEITHEALVSGWPTLRGWLDEELASRHVLERLQRSVAEWERLGRASEVLWSARQLDELPALAMRSLSREATSFVATSQKAIRRARRARIARWLAIPVSLLLTTALAAGASSARRRAAVDAAMGAGRELDAHAKATATAAASARALALAAFERDDLGEAEALWKKALASEEDADRERRAVLAAVGNALARDPRDAAARALAADVTLARLLFAERLHKQTLVGALKADLDAYDDGSRRARLAAPGHVTARTDPPGAAMTLARYREDTAGRLIETDAAPLTQGERRALEPGSYVITSEAAGRYPTRYPFVVGRSEEAALRIPLPRAEDVPEGLIYVPTGRALYGVGDDEGTRGFCTHQPQHEVEVRAFLIARTEVTHADYIAFLRALPEAARKERLPAELKILPGGGIGWELHGRVFAPAERYCSGVQPCTDWSDLPVMGVNREDATRYARWLADTGKVSGARLCTDREWERAARGADDRQFPASNAEPGPTEACTLATYGGDASRAGPCAAGSHPASRSPFGVDDLTGNAVEWTAGPADAARATQGIIRGAAWSDSGFFLTISNRGVQDAGGRGAPFGVRICADVRGPP